MIKCQVCGKECKTVQGLAGHMQNKHGILGAHPDAERLPPSPKLVSEQQLSELAERVDELEGSVAMVETELEAERGVERLVGAAEQSKELTERDAALLKQLVERVNKTAELARNNAEQLKNIAQQAKRSVVSELFNELMEEAHQAQGKSSFTLQEMMAEENKKTVFGRELRRMAGFK